LELGRTRGRDARNPGLRIDFGDLVTLSLREEIGALQRMREDWSSGVNRFDRPGEILFEARVGPRLVGICGLNRDPYAQSPEIGRARHLYVVQEFRRCGIGRRLISEIVDYASRSFARVRLRTLRADADRFYVALGFRRVVGEPEVTHELEALFVPLDGHGGNRGR
jgi:GNAT superfamily N-acetyltransferase